MTTHDRFDEHEGSSSSARWILIGLLALGGAAACGASDATAGSGSGGGRGGGGPAEGGAGGGGVTGHGGVTGAAVERWIVDNTTSIHGVPPMVLGAPVVTATQEGDALCFDGDDAVVLPANPLQGLGTFTLEALVRVDGVTPTASDQPRFLHIETADASRVTMEARVTQTDWYLDTFLLSGAQSKTLADGTKVHPVGQWAWVALTYASPDMRHFVNGVEEASGAVTVPATGEGKMSLGVRQNLVYWFSGCIRELRITSTALAATDLQRL